MATCRGMWLVDKEGEGRGSSEEEAVQWVDAADFELKK